MQRYHIYHLKNLHLKGYNPVNIGYEYCCPSHPCGPATRKHVLLHYIKSGKGIFTRGEKVYELDRGKCFIIRPREITFYRADEEDPWHYIWIGFTVDSIPAVFAEHDILDIDYLDDIFTEIRDKHEYYNGVAGNNGAREAWLAGKLTEIITRIELSFSSSAVTNAKSKIYAIKNYIDANLSSTLSTSDIANEFHFNASYLSRQFKEVIGMSPQNYIVNTRLKEAAKLMRECDFTPLVAATAVGYTDIQLFSKMFKRKYGVSPREYIKNNQP